MSAVEGKKIGEEPICGEVTLTVHKCPDDEEILSQLMATETEQEPKYHCTDGPVT